VTRVAAVRPTNMKKLAFALAFAAALPALANTYKFHLKVTDGKTGLRANPQFADLKLSPKQLEDAKQNRVMLFSNAEGAHWHYLMLSWMESHPDAEQTLNDHGAASAADSDFGLVPLSTKTVRMRCLREQCTFAATAANGTHTEAKLRKGETKELPLDADFVVGFKR